MKNILLVEDDMETTRLLQLHFHSQMYRLTCCGNGKEAIATIDKHVFDLILLDISLPDMTGLEICKFIREAGSNVPIIMLTSRDAEADKVLALDLGADDYITKPFGSLELMSRVKALLRRSAQSHPEAVDLKKQIAYKDLVINPPGWGFHSSFLYIAIKARF